MEKSKWEGHCKVLKSNMPEHGELDSYRNTADVAMASIPGLHPENLYERVFGLFPIEEQQTPIFTEADHGCDGSHLRRLHILVGVLLQHGGKAFETSLPHMAEISISPLAE